MLKKVVAFCAITGSMGFCVHKGSGPYGQRIYLQKDYNMEDVLMESIIKGISVPFLMGYYLSCTHDKILYMSNSKYYQKEIDDYGEVYKNENENKIKNPWCE
jgi:hypothetical protein